MPTARSNHPAALLAALLAMLIVTAAVARTSQAAFTATSGSDAGWGSGTVTITDNDAGVALFDSATNGMLDGGSTVQRCIQATYTGDITANVHIRLHATASGALAPYLDTVIAEGTGGTTAECTGFTADRTLFTGTLAALSASHSTYGTGVGDWRATTTGQAKTYRITTTVQNVPQAQASAASATFTWEAQSDGPEPAPEPALVAAVRADTPAGYWRLGDTGPSFADSSGNNRPLTLVGTGGQGTSGIPGGATDKAFTTGTAHGQAPDAPWNSPTGSFAVEAWIKPNGSTSEAYLVEKYDVPANNGFILRLNNRAPSAYTLDGAGLTPLHGPTLTTGDWAHLVFSYDSGTGYGTLYVNGTQVNTAIMRAPADGTSTIKVGARGDDAARVSIGDLDEVAFYDHALAADRVAAHYTAGSTP